MIASFFYFAESMFGGRLAAAAEKLQTFSLVLLALVWAAPPAALLLRRFLARRRSARILYWTCFCGADNAPAVSFCGRCKLPPRLSWAEKMAGHPGGRRLLGTLRALSCLWRGAGWIFYYGFPAALAWSLEMLSPAGAPALRTLFGAGALLAGVAAMLAAGRALGRWGGGVFPRVASLAGAGALAGFTFLFAALWAAAPFPPGKPLAAVHLFPDGRVRFTPAGGGAPVEAPGRLEEGGVAFSLQYAVVTWPLFQVRQTVPLSLAGRPVAPENLTRFCHWIVKRWTGDLPHRPRAVLLAQTFYGAPGTAYHVREPLQGAGLALLGAESPP